MKSFYLGGDASKGYADFVILDSRKRVVEPAFRLDDTFEGHSRLYAVLEALVSKHEDVEFKAALESTGGYENNWLASLGRFQASLPIQVARLNPSFVRHYAQGEGVRVTTDAVSAEYIAGYLIAHPGKVVYNANDALSSLRSHWRFIEQLVEQRKALLNQLEGLLYRAHPGLIPYLTSGMPQWALKLIGQYPTARRLSRARAKTVAKIPFVTPDRAAELIASAEKSVASADDVSMEFLVRELARQLLHLGDLIKKQKERLAAYLREADEHLGEDIALLKSYGSIGEYSAVGLLLEIQSVERFPSAKKIASFFGVHPAFKESGDGMSVVRMSKRGSTRMRALLFMITLNAIQHNEVIAPLYERLTEEKGMERMAAIGVCMHKTLRILYGILKSRRPFDPAIERGHRRRASTAQASPPVDRKRRFQTPDNAAPISARAKKRRRQQKHSQGAVHTMNGMSTSTAVSENLRGDDSKSLLKEQSNLA